MPVIPALWGAEVRRSQVQTQLGQFSDLVRPHLRIKNLKKDWVYSSARGPWIQSLVPHRHTPHGQKWRDYSCSSLKSCGGKLEGTWFISTGTSRHY